MPTDGRASTTTIPQKNVHWPRNLDHSQRGGGARSLVQSSRPGGPKAAPPRRRRVDPHRPLPARARWHGPVSVASQCGPSHCPKPTQALSPAHLPRAWPAPSPTLHAAAPRAERSVGPLWGRGEAVWWVRRAFCRGRADVLLWRRLRLLTSRNVSSTGEAGKMVPSKFARPGSGRRPREVPVGRCGSDKCSQFRATCSCPRLAKNGSRTAI